MADLGRDALIYILFITTGLSYIFITDWCRKKKRRPHG